MCIAIDYTNDLGIIIIQTLYTVLLDSPNIHAYSPIEFKQLKMFIIITLAHAHVEHVHHVLEEIDVQIK